MSELETFTMAEAVAVLSVRAAVSVLRLDSVAVCRLSSVLLSLRFVEHDNNISRAKPSITARNQMSLSFFIVIISSCFSQ